jgi:activator of HSP90 ATPase
MMNDMTNQEARAHRPSRRQAIIGIAVASGGLAAFPANSAAETKEEISHAAEAIHQVPVFKASRKRLYETLLDSKQFDQVIQLGAAMKSMSLGSKPTEINREPGGAFTLFGGHITGRQIELLPNERIVQAWREGSWDPGVYSIAKFELVEQGSGCKIVFDHTGFPKGAGEHLAVGWKADYWEPLEKLLAS